MVHREGRLGSELANAFSVFSAFAGESPAQPASMSLSMSGAVVPYCGRGTSARGPHVCGSRRRRSRLFGPAMKDASLCHIPWNPGLRQHALYWILGAVKESEAGMMKRYLSERAPRRFVAGCISRLLGEAEEMVGELVVSCFATRAGGSCRCLFPQTGPCFASCRSTFTHGTPWQSRCSPVSQGLVPITHTGGVPYLVQRTSTSIIVDRHN